MPKDLVGAAVGDSGRYRSFSYCYCDQPRVVKDSYIKYNDVNLRDHRLPDIPMAGDHDIIRNLAGAEI